MKRWEIVIPKAIEKAIDKLDKPIREDVYKLLDYIETLENPRVKGEGLTANKAGLWRYRVRDYRIIAKIEDKTITITLTKMGHRSTVYD